MWDAGKKPLVSSPSPQFQVGGGNEPHPLTPPCQPNPPLMLTFRPSITAGFREMDGTHESERIVVVVEFEVVYCVEFEVV